MARPKKSADDKPIAPATHAQLPLQQVSQQFPPQQQPQISGLNSLTGLNGSPAGAPMGMAPQAPAFSNNQGRVIDVDNFMRVRDSVYQRLTTIQGMIGSFATDYLAQTNLLLGEPTFGDGGDLGVSSDFALQNLASAVGMPAVFAPAAEEKKERKKRQHDPNAPKRPLTPYFLYMQTARPIIAVDLGEGVPKGAVQEEGQRRWASMSAQEKLGWNQAYQYNLRLYNARVHSYKAGNLAAKEMSDDEAVRYCEEYNIPMPHVGGVESEAAMDGGAVAPQQLLAPEVAVPEVKPAGKPKASRKRKSEAVETPVAAVASPDKKPRKRTSTKPVEQPEAEPKKGRAKKAKSG